MQQALLNLPRLTKQFVVIALDISLACLATWLAYSLRFDELYTPINYYQWLVYPLAVAIAIPVFIKVGLYRAVFRYTGLAAMNSILLGVALYGVALSVLLFILAWPMVPRSLGILQPLILLVLITTSRAVARLWLSQQSGALRRSQAKGKLLIYGAGDAGAQTAIGLLQSPSFQLIGFIDEDPQLKGKLIHGQRVFSPKQIGFLVDRYGVTDILIAIPSLSRQRRNQLLGELAHHKVHLRSLPNLADLASGKISVSDIKELDIEDLLGRDPVPPDAALLAKNIQGKVVLVTGAGGSIGSEICRQIVAIGPAKLLLIEQSEFALYAIHQELEGKLAGREIALIPLLASVQDARRLREIMTAWHPKTVYHAAAYKHVPLVEHNVSEGVRNNVFGTLRSAQVAIECGVADFVLISTDKAVRPTNIMGASKRLAEMALQALAARASGTQFSMVRFGNVLGSSGSVVPRFRQQIRDGGPITLTHPDITRFFMTIPEASQLVIQAGAMARGGDVFVLDMGEPVRIIDLAKRMIELSGLNVRGDKNPDGDVAIEITGLRPGEKLYEELLIGDNPKPTAHPRIMKAHEEFIDWPVLQEKLSELETILQVNDVVTAREMICRLVPGYQPHDEIVDWVYVAKDIPADVART